MEVAKKTPGQAPKKVPKMSEEKQRKIWAVVLYSMVVVIVGLVITIAITLSVRTDRKNGSKENDDTMSEEEEAEKKKLEDIKEYNAIQEAIDKVINSSNVPTEKDVVNAYHYYISETDNETVKNMLRMNLLTIEMVNDMEKTRGDELINVALEIDEVEKSINSAATVVSLADYYGRAELENKYQAIMDERLISEGYDPNEEAEG